MTVEVGKIDFSYYAGENSDEMKLNEPVSDRFMHLSQIRHDVVIMQQDLNSGSKEKNNPKFLTDVKGSTYFMYLDDGAIADDVIRAIFRKPSKAEGHLMTNMHEGYQT
jgi:hypothetical protein